MSELKCCPFCGGEAKLVENNYYTDAWSVICKNCYTDSDRYHTESKAIKAWNTRKPIGTKNSDMLKIDDMQKQATLIQQMICETVSYLFDDEGNVIMSEIIKWLQSEVKESEKE